MSFILDMPTRKWTCFYAVRKVTDNGSAAWRGAGLPALKPIRITKLKI